MALYRCPRCEQVVRINAKRCLTCGLYFDLEHEPVPDESKGDSLKLSKKEKRIIIIVIAAIVVVLVIAVLVTIGNAKMYYAAIQRWQREASRRVVTEWPSWG